jgi:hypothetical protein
MSEVCVCGDDVREAVRGTLHDLLGNPAYFGGAKPPQERRTVQERLSEVELASRVRHRLDGEVYLHGSGKDGRKDIEDFGRNAAVEVKYFLSISKDGTPQPRGGVATEDWDWLLEPSYELTVGREAHRFWVCFFPMACTGANVPKSKKRVEPPPDGFLFQNAVSRAENSLHPAWGTIAAMVSGTTSARKSVAKKRPAFLSKMTRDQTIPAGGAQIRASVLGEPHTDAVWAVVYERLSAGTAPCGRSVP